MNLPKDLDEAILLYLYDELADADKRELEAHIQDNPQSRKRLQEMQAFHHLLDRRAALTPSAALLRKVRSDLRRRLREERLTLPQESWWAKLLRPIQAKRPGWQAAAAATLLLLGVVVGRYLLPAEAAHPPLFQQAASMPSISNVDLIEYDPKTGVVTVHYKTVQEVALQGDIEDASIRRVLSYAIRTEDHPGRRLAAVKAAASRTPFADEELQAALIQAMEKDEVAGVRLRAAKVLQALPLSQPVKDAFIRVLLKDPNPAIRIEALESLSKGVAEDVRPILRNAAEDDDNEYVRLKAARTLERTKNPDSGR